MLVRPGTWRSNRTTLVHFPTLRKVICYTAQITMKTIEVERKFLLTPETTQTILALQSSFESVLFRDEYFDEDLALKDTWLRKRNDGWELKLPVTSDGLETDKRRKATVYRELMGPDVWSELAHLSDHRDQLSCYAALTTKRIQLTVPWKQYSVNVTIDDCTSDDGFQCNIGELEVMVAEANEVNAASQVLDDLAGHLEVHHIEDKEGKLIKYIRQKRPEMFKKLVDALKP